MTQRFNERMEQTLHLVESADGLRRVRAIGMVADVINANDRRYRRAVVERAIAELKLSESAGAGRLMLTGEAEHPADKGARRPSLLETVVKWEASSLDAAGNVLLEGVILDTNNGRDIRTLIEAGVPVGVSMRGYGEAKRAEEGGKRFQDVTELTITGFDLVSEPAFADARLLESQERHMSEETKDLQEAAGNKALQDLLEKERQERDALSKQLDEAKKAQTELADRKRQDAVEAAIVEATKDLKYGNDVNKLFIEAVRDAKVQDPESVKTFVEAKRREYDGLMANRKLGAMGQVDVRGPVFEQETGLAAYLQPAHELTESILRAGSVMPRNLKTAEDSASVFTRRYLELYDRQQQAHLVREAQQFADAQQVSDLSLPYSVMRAIVEQVWPELIAANVYDIGIASQSPERLYFETYAGEAGATAVAVTNEAVTGDHGNWVALANKRLNPGSVVLTNNTGVTTYAEGADYVIDYGGGRIMTLATGATTDSQALLIDYTYEAMRKGELATIERGKNTLAYKTLEIAADRMAAEISSEAVVFSRSQLGYDAVGRVLSNLVRKIQRSIDQGMHYAALASSLQQANNSGGSWASSTDPITDLVEYIGIAKTKIYMRYYVPTSIVLSQTNADRLSNWEGFKREGFPNAVLTAAGFAGSIKGLPIFATPTFPDSYVLVVNREIVMHRVFQAMTLKGPYPTYSSDKLVAADQYYVEEYNGTDSPVVEKAAHVFIT